MKPKVMVAAIVVVIGVALGAVNFMESSVEYMDFASAQKLGKKAQVKGEWGRDRDSGFDAEKTQFVFFMKDENATVVRVVLDGAKPNNFEIATSVVAKCSTTSGRKRSNGKVPPRCSICTTSWPPWNGGGCSRPMI